MANAGDTIAGAGRIGLANDNLTFVNSATVDANVSGNYFAIDTGANAIVNDGLLEASGFGSLLIYSDVANSKTIEASGTSGGVGIEGNVTNTNNGLILVSGTDEEFFILGNEISGGKLQTIGSGASIVADGALTIAGATIVAGSLVEASGGTLFVVDTNVGSKAVLESFDGATLTVSGTLSNGGTLYAVSSGGMIEIASGATVSGGTIEVGNGVVAIDASGSEAVLFGHGGSGGLAIADGSGATNLYSGRISAFGVNAGGTAHADHSEYIELSNVTYSSGEISGSYSGNATSGMLTVSSGGVVVAAIDFAGSYTSGNFHFVSGADGNVQITDPAVINGGGVHSANIALFGNYMAAFVTEVGGNGGAVAIHSASAEQHSLLTHPNHR